MSSIGKKPMAGVTLVEIMIVVALVAISYVGIVVLMNKVTQGTWSVSKTIELTSQAQQAMTWIAEDFKNAKSASMGNLVRNYGFETPFELNQPMLSFWNDLANSPVGNGQAVDRVRGGGTAVKGGFSSLVMPLPVANDYFSDTTTINDNGQYIISGWVKADGTTASFNLVDAVSKADLFAPLSNNQNFWLHLTTTVVLGAGTQVQIKLNQLPGGTTAYFDDLAISPTTVVFNDTTPIDGTHNVYEYDTSRGDSDTAHHARLKHYRLRYVRVAAPEAAAPGQLFRERWVGPGVNDYEVVSGEALVNNVRSLTITHYNQESFEVELILERAMAGKTRRYQIKNTFTPLVK